MHNNYESTCACARAILSPGRTDTALQVGSRNVGTFTIGFTKGFGLARGTLVIPHTWAVAHRHPSATEIPPTSERRLTCLGCPLRCLGYDCKYVGRRNLRDSRNPRLATGNASIPSMGKQHGSGHKTEP